MPNRRYNQFFQTLHTKPILLDCQFKVAPADSAGYGITGLVGPGIQNVFMHTSATPAAGSPNPAAGYIYVQLQDNYQGFYGIDYFLASPNSGSDVVVTAAGAALTVGQVYVITALGTTTAADWVTLGVPVGVTPAVGVAFVAAATGAGTGSGKVQLPAAAGSGLGDIEVVGVPGLSIYSKAASIAGKSGGAYLVLQCLGATNSTTTTLVAKAPATGTVIGLQMYFSGSMIKVQGE